jgi:sulfane dehydrogenase subunit SoxC
VKGCRSGRRRFLKNSATLAGLAAGAVLSANGQPLDSQMHAGPPIGDLRAYGRRSRFVTSARGPLPYAQYTPLGDSMGTITPNSLFHVNGTGGFHSHSPGEVYGGGLPDFDPRQHRLLIHGMVDHPLIFTMDELMRFPSVSRFHFIECSGGQGGTQYAPIRRLNFLNDTNMYNHPHVLYSKSSNAEWTGALLSVLLNEVRVQKGASWLVAEGAEPNRLTRSIPLEKAMDDCLVAYGQNGEPIRPEQGYPLRLVVPGWEGDTNIKWLRRIKVVDEPYMTMAETNIYPSIRPDGKARWFLFEMPPHSVITFPSVGQRLPVHGFYEIRGLAWSGGGAIRRVEVSSDGGRTYKDAELQEPILRMAHTRFRLPWVWDGAEAVIQSRCTDEKGQVQPSLAELSKAWGVSLDYWQETSNYINHFNPIHPWKVTREGSVQNALFA